MTRATAWKDEDGDTVQHYEIEPDDMAELIRHTKGLTTIRAVLARAIPFMIGEYGRHHLGEELAREHMKDILGTG
jgi:hypothetical protein